MPDVFRKQYRELSDAEKARLEAVKTKAEELHELLCENGNPADLTADGRCLSLARTKLEETVMWAVKGITN